MVRTQLPTDITTSKHPQASLQARSYHAKPGFDSTASALGGAIKRTSNIGACRSALCRCGSPQTIDHILESCPIYKSPNDTKGANRSG